MTRKIQRKYSEFEFKVYENLSVKGRFKANGVTIGLIPKKIKLFSNMKLKRRERERKCYLLIKSKQANSNNNNI